MPTIKINLIARYYEFSAHKYYIDSNGDIVDMHNYFVDSHKKELEKYYNMFPDLKR